MPAMRRTVLVLTHGRGADETTNLKTPHISRIPKVYFVPVAVYRSFVLHSRHHRIVPIRLESQVSVSSADARDIFYRRCK